MVWSVIAQLGGSRELSRSTIPSSLIFTMREKGSSIADNDERSVIPMLNSRKDHKIFPVKYSTIFLFHIYL